MIEPVNLFPRIRRRVQIQAVLWTLLIAGLLGWDIWHGRQTVIKLADAEAKANLQKDLAFRRWASARGGLYVPQSEKVHPNPYLEHVPNRDITTPDGIPLTLHNPATILREMMQEQAELYGVRARITGRQVLNPVNSPDAWEQKALLIVEKTLSDYSETTELDGQPVRRVMQPMIMEEPCLKCHGWTGVPVGGLRGATDVAIPLDPYYVLWRADALKNTIWHGGLWLLGLAMLIVSARRERSHAEENARHDSELARHRETLERTVAERTDMLRRTVDDLQAAKEEAERANAAKTEFLSRMSHELRTPMNAVLGFTHLLEDSPDIQGNDRNNVHEVAEAGQHLLVLINEVLDLARIDSGRIELSTENIGVDGLIESALALIRPLAAARRITIERSGSHGMVLRSDYSRSRQVLINLLSNAVKYNLEGGRIVVDANPTEDRQRIRIEVQDTGRGIAAEDLQRLFRPFERLVSAYEAIEGCGIGLALSRRLLEAMDGTLGVTSTLGEGSRFWFELPAGDPSGNTLTTTAAALLLKKKSSRPERIVLHVEDNPDNLRLMRKVLEQRPHWRLVEAGSGGDALDTVRGVRPDLILLDINLPDMDGFEVLAILRECMGTNLPPVHAVSANALIRDAERGKAASFDGYLTKPVDITQLLDLLDRIEGTEPEMQT